ncbi:beta-lactamase family protein [Actinomadura barringtoniae]|uniref:Beta-lactamase family protein n=1 Tax=Actinomadura barringtoniae TaxID=1427535 RepID=A0A939P7S9_9ACTN|nr:serine hydrolase domain-containing protein [Actinomadura barringtoniae]MBO2447356.1 beta-lactamase family protein [Actinomadura barringtoniae]
MFKHQRASKGAFVLAVAVAGSLAAGSVAAAGTTSTSAGHERLREVMTRLTTVDGGPGALVQVRDRRGSAVLTSGVADVKSQAPVRGDSTFRIGSMSKMFVATTVLQLVGEHRVSLDAPVERYLPGVIRGADNDGREISVRQLLQHTSGLPDYLKYIKPQDVIQDPLAHHDTRDMVKVALAHKRDFKPGDGWHYSNTNYLLAGMLIEKVTGHSYGQEIRHRIIKPLKLRETYVPGDSSVIPGPHPRGYARPGANAPLIDITAINPTVAGAAGGMISSATDLNHFMAALVRGKLLRPAQLREMMRTRSTDDGSNDGSSDGSSDGDGSSGRAYGLGLESNPLPCGGVYWGHSGDVLGYQSMGGVTTDGRQATVMVNLDPGGTDAQDDDVKAAVETALCEAES